jgi:hypothetical protein
MTQQPPPYQQRPSYLSTPPEAVEALVRKGRRDIVFGAIWLLFGLAITVFSMAEFGPYVVVAWGPALYGIYKIIKGVVTVRKHS